MSILLGHLQSVLTGLFSHLFSKRLATLCRSKCQIVGASHLKLRYKEPQNSPWYQKFSQEFILYQLPNNTTTTVYHNIPESPRTIKQTGLLKNSSVLLIKTLEYQLHLRIFTTIKRTEPSNGGNCYSSQPYFRPLHSISPCPSPYTTPATASRTSATRSTTGYHSTDAFIPTAPDDSPTTHNCADSDSSRGNPTNSPICEFQESPTPQHQSAMGAL
jgi:hypothetical protein